MTTISSTDLTAIANKARTEPLRVILNGLGKDAAQIIAYARAVLGAHASEAGAGH